MNVYGTFKVTTEGDVEGRTTRDLGVYSGFIDEIALHLADKSFYTLNFQEVIFDDQPQVPTKDSVHISFDYTLKLDEKKVKELFKDRPVDVKVSNYYKSFVISKPISEEEKLENIKRAALKKLTKEEKEALGL